MTERKLPPAEYLRQRLRYEPETGKLFWLASDEMPRSWINRYAGKEAFACIDDAGYLAGRLSGQTHRAHRVVWALVNGCVDGLAIDHIDGDRTNNRLENLRVADQAANTKNRKLGKNNTSGFNGVTFNRAAGSWQATIWVDGRKRHLGNFKDREAAIMARRNANEAFGYHALHGTRKSSN